MSDPFQFIGQWWGLCISQTTPGVAVMNVELVEGEVVAKVYLYPNNSEIPGTATDEFKISEVIGQTVEVPVAPFVAKFGQPLSERELREIFPDIAHAFAATLSFVATGSDVIEATWKTPIGNSGKVTFKKTVMPDVSVLKSEAHVTSWDDFRSEVSKVKFGKYLFRGQKKPYPLQTSFHRTKRKILERYLDRDIPALHRTISGKSNHFFDMDSADQRGAFLNLAQHYGFPTPLLDWSHSPFVAAWFAYQEHKTKPKEQNSGVVRIFALDRELLGKFEPYQTLTLAPPHISILEALAIENDRATPQQGVLTLTNIQNVEEHLLELSRRLGEPIVKAYDLPIAEVDVVINELALMGITRSTLFPSIESLCVDARDKWFGEI